MSKIKLLVATKAFILFEGKVLILRESSSYKEGTNAGRYDLPGGRVEPGQRFDESLKREVREETGLDVTIGDPIYVGEWRPVVKDQPLQIVGIFFLCSATSKDVKLSVDHDEYKWIDPKSYKQYNLMPAVVRVFEKDIKS